MVKMKIMLKDVIEKFKEKYPEGEIWYEGSWSAIDPDTGKTITYKGNSKKVNVVYKSQGRPYTYSVGNNLDLAHKLGLMLDVGYETEYLALLHAYNRAKSRLDNPDSSFGFGSPPSIEELAHRLQDAENELEEFKKKYSMIA